MFHKCFIWFFTYCKRLLKKPSFLVMLCIFPLLCGGIRIYGSQKHPLLSIALYNEGNTSLAKDTITYLTDSESNIHFYEVQSISALKKDVSNTTAECGYIFTSDYEITNILDNQALKESIEVLKSPSTMLDGSVNELVFAAFFHSYCQELLKDYIQKEGLLSVRKSIPEVIEKCEEYYKIRCEDDSTFSIDISNPENLDATKAIDNQQKVRQTYLSRLCRGVLSLLLLIGAMSAACHLLEDRKTALFLPLPSSLRHLIQLSDILTPCMLLSISGLAGLLLLPAHEFILKECFFLAVYSLVLTILMYLITQLPHAETLLPAAMPYILCGALVCTPVLIDLSAYIPLFRFIKYWFANYYYLMWF